MKHTTLLTAACSAALLTLSFAHAETWNARPATVGAPEPGMEQPGVQESGVQEPAISPLGGQEDGGAQDVSAQADSSTYIGTSLPEPRSRIYLEDPNTAFPDQDRDTTGYVVGTAGPEKGTGDEYGSVLFDVGALP